MTTKPLYLLIKLDVDDQIVFDYKDASNYAKNFCDSMEFELIDHCLEEQENDDLYIGCDSIKKLSSKRYYDSITQEGLEVWP
tara:strand:- start:18 stop:263 length:246 start_codon:yes stop_codon:yes gene_type:complete